MQRLIQQGSGRGTTQCISVRFVQVKRKRKEHRSLDSILFEDDGELEYFDVLNLLPLSNVRLEFDEEDARNNNLGRRRGDSLKSGRFKALEYFGARPTAEKRVRSNATDEEKCTESIDRRIGDRERRKKELEPRLELEEELVEEELCREETSQKSRSARPSPDCYGDDNTDRFRDDNTDRGDSLSDDERRSTSPLTTSPEEGVRDRRVEEAEDYKSIWISDTEEQEDMSRRPQVLKVVDSDVTKRRHRRSSPEIDELPSELRQKDETFRGKDETFEEHADIAKLDGKPDGEPASEQVSPFSFS